MSAPNKKTEAFVKMPIGLVDSEGRLSLSAKSYRLIFALMSEHAHKGGQRNGELMAPRRQLEKKHRIGRHQISSAVDECERAGLIKVKRGVGRKPSTYTLTWLPLPDGSMPEQPFRSGCQTAPSSGAKQHPQDVIVGVKQHPQRPKSSGAEQHPLYRESYQDGAVGTAYRDLGDDPANGTGGGRRHRMKPMMNGGFDG